MKEQHIKCLATIEDCYGTYFLEGKQYLVVEEYEDSWLVECENPESYIMVDKDDKDFQLA